MNPIAAFLDSSTIHGLSHIKKERRWSRLFWITVVFSGFSTAGVLIYQSFKSWSESPFTTTVQTLPISELTFPNVTVCPPRQTFTNLNFDLLMADNMTFENDSRNDLLTDALDLISSYHYEELMKNQSFINESKRYSNWYHGLTRIIPAYYSNKRMYNQLINYVETVSPSGSISSQRFGEEFDVDKVRGFIFYHIEIVIPESARNISNLRDAIKKQAHDA